MSENLRDGDFLTHTVQLFALHGNNYLLVKLSLVVLFFSTLLYLLSSTMVNKASCVKVCQLTGINAMGRRLTERPQEESELKPHQSHQKWNFSSILRIG